MPSSELKKYIFKLDDIEKKVRKKTVFRTSIYIHYLTIEFMEYWRYLQTNHAHEIKGWMWDELYFTFNQRLFDFARCRLDIYWMIYEYDDKQLFFLDHKERPFWRRRNA